MTSTSHITSVTNTLHSPFSQVGVSLNDMSISSSITTYPCRAYIENNLNYDCNAKEVRLSAGFYYMDNNLHVLDPNPEDHDVDVNVGLQYRHTICTGKALDMIRHIRTHIHNISVQAHKPLQLIEALTATGWGKHKETLMATYKAVMRPALEYASSIWSSLASSTSITKLQIMQDAALRTAT